MGLRETILGAKDLCITPLEVPEWETTIYVKKLSLSEFLEFQKTIASAEKDSEKANDDVTLICVSYGVCDEQGVRIFSTEDAALLKDKGWKVMVRIAEAVSDLNDIGKKSVEDAAKN